MPSKVAVTVAGLVQTTLQRATSGGALSALTEDQLPCLTDYFVEDRPVSACRNAYTGTGNGTNWFASSSSSERVELSFR
eukprot:scaffold456009_cov52-Prasinocladus_malaysianus.AAC.1